MRTSLLIVIFFLFFSGTTMSEFSESEIQINRYIGEYKKKLKKDGIYLIGVGGSEKNGKCTLIDLDFEIDEILNKDRATELIVYHVNNFLKFLNSKQGIEKHVVEYPITTKFLQISFIGKMTDVKDPSTFDLVKFSHGTIQYFHSYDMKPLKLVCEEVFERGIDN